MTSSGNGDFVVSGAGSSFHSRSADLRLEPDGAVVCRLDGTTRASFAKSPDRSFRVTVADPGPVDEDNPPVFGRYDIVADGIRFTPYFPFEPGVMYRVVFDDRALGTASVVDRRSIEFSIPVERDGGPPEVERIYPTSDCLPENVLRFYVRFSRAMRRGGGHRVGLLGPDGEPVADALYRPPVELWDPGMRYLTVLLDPGRLKRLVGPNRALGPALRAGGHYRLHIGPGMTAENGRPMARAYSKPFVAGAAVRESIATERWKISAPRRGTRNPVSIVLPHPMDWVSMSRSLAVESGDQVIGGRISIDQDERRWHFRPTAPWAAGDHRIVIATDVEDVCGNGLHSAFDRPIRAVADDVGSNRAIDFSPT